MFFIEHDQNLFSVMQHTYNNHFVSVGNSVKQLFENLDFKRLSE